ncbi:MAG: hypothetical protein AAGI11_22400 [Pseudomonadota bacterium]
MSKIKLKQGEEAQSITLKRLLDQFGGKISRLPILQSNGSLYCVIHESLLQGFIASKALEQDAEADDQALDPEKSNLRTLMDDPHLGKTLKETVAFVSQAATLAEAKAAMEKIKGCADVFVTNGGSRDEPVVGWITNKRILRHTKA